MALLAKAMLIGSGMSMSVRSMNWNSDCGVGGSSSRGCCVGDPTWDKVAKLNDPALMKDLEDRTDCRSVPVRDGGRAPIPRVAKVGLFLVGFGGLLV